MGSASLPKQYLPLEGRLVIEWSLQPILARSDCAGAAIALSADDPHWARSTLARDPRVRTAPGGAERAESVLAGLRLLNAAANDWVLVHDAARPCLSSEELDSLIDTVRDDEVGGLLAAPVVDTLKRADDNGRVSETVSREQLWRALTPQMFRAGLLLEALTDAARNGVNVTDEAQAIERLGFKPRLVAGSTDNIKITLPEDLPRAARILAERRNSST